MKGSMCKPSLRTHPQTLKKCMHCETVDLRNEGRILEESEDVELWMRAFFILREYILYIGGLQSPLSRLRRPRVQATAWSSLVSLRC